MGKGTKKKMHKRKSRHNSSSKSSSRSSSKHSSTPSSRSRSRRRHHSKKDRSRDRSRERRRYRSRSRSRGRDRSRDRPRESRFGGGEEPRRKFDFGHSRSGPAPSLAGTNVGPTTFKKNFYADLVNPKTHSTSEVNEWRGKNKITVGIENSSASAQGVPNPILNYDEVKFPSGLTSAFSKAGFKEPTPIQAQGWPIAMKGHDLIGIAKTGSGKTLAFMIPAFIHLMSQDRPRPGEGPVVLVLAPTRELAVQINDECVKFGGGIGIRVVAVYGGAEKYQQKRALFRGVDVVIATPGRLIDLMEQGATNLKRVTYLVLDEADRMLDMGFEDQIREIVSKVRSDRQTLMWSATWPPNVKTLARELCQEDPIKIQVGAQDLAVNDKITQKIEIMDEDEKRARLIEILKQYHKRDKILVFCQTKRGCEVLSQTLERLDFPVNALHGDKTQKERDRVMAEFKLGEKPILIATDLAARGLDIKDIKCVINYDFPMQIEDYIHRVGRTGRAGAEGMSYTFFTRDNAKYAGDLIKILRDAKQVVPPELESMPRYGGRRFGGGSSLGCKYLTPFFCTYVRSSPADLSRSSRSFRAFVIYTGSSGDDARLSALWGCARWDKFVRLCRRGERRHADGA
eukprot:TRINITY_DN3809_c0_g2_i3.p1 TRINITY_DN3809_c0_g2~~TRINITY_DN3809_c0_g2_i3.p1  ORF type:complete len:626 (+),score=100.00 TRINITY_DN3809_c0_g2_i3:96-1973(+)